MKKVNKKVAVIYCRNATKRQTNWNQSLEAQAQWCLGKAKKDGSEVVEIIKERKSGKSLNRAGMKRLITLVEENKINSVYVTDINRLSRNLKDYLSIRDLCKNHNVDIKITCSLPNTQIFNEGVVESVLEMLKDNQNYYGKCKQ